MIGLVVCLLGGVVWIGLRGSADPATFAVGALLSGLAAWATRLPGRGGVAPAALARALRLWTLILIRFAADLAVANARQLILVLSPRLAVRPRWIRFATVLEKPATRTVLGVLISLTPGTITEELRGREYVIHVLDAGPDEDIVAAIRDRLEDPLSRLEAL